MVLDVFIRSIVKKNPDLKLKLKKADMKLSPFQYVFQTIYMTGFVFVVMLIFIFIIFVKKSLFLLLIGIISSILLIPLVYKFFFSLVDVKIRKLSRELDSDLLFVSEYLLVSLESGLPIGNAIENLSKVNRPGGRFFKRVYTEFKAGKSFDEALLEGSRFSASKNMKNLLKKLKDSMDVGVDLKKVLEMFIEDGNEKKLLEIKAFAKRLNPIIMMYLLFGVVIPSLGVTFFILAAAMLEMTPALLKYILVVIFLVMFAFQYFAYSIFKFNRTLI